MQSAARPSARTSAPALAAPGSCDVPDEHRALTGIADGGCPEGTCGRCLPPARPEAPDLRHELRVARGRIRLEVGDVEPGVTATYPLDVWSCPAPSRAKSEPRLWESMLHSLDQWALDGCAEGSRAVLRGRQLGGG